MYQVNHCSLAVQLYCNGARIHSPAPTHSHIHTFTHSLVHISISRTFTHSHIYPFAYSHKKIKHAHTDCVGNGGAYKAAAHLGVPVT